MDPARTSRIVAIVIADSEAHRQGLVIERAEERAHQLIRITSAGVALVAVGAVLTIVATLVHWAPWLILPLCFAYGLTGLDVGVRPEDR